MKNKVGIRETRYTMQLNQSSLFEKIDRKSTATKSCSKYVSTVYRLYVHNYINIQIITRHINQNVLLSDKKDNLAKKDSFLSISLNVPYMHLQHHILD